MLPKKYLLYVHRSKRSKDFSVNTNHDIFVGRSDILNVN